MSETEKPSGNWVEQAVAKIPAEKLPKPEVEEVVPAVEAVEEQPKAEAPEPKAKDDDDDETETLVDIRALKAERGKRKEAEKRAREQEIEFARAEERLAIIQQTWADEQKQRHTQEQKAQPQAEAPDAETDPLGHIQWQLAQEREARAQLEQQFKQQQGLSQQQQMVAQVAHGYQTAVKQYSATKPDFMEAYNHLYQSLDREEALRGVADPNVRRNNLMNSEMQFVALQMRAGRNPAEVIYQMAELRGYKPGATQTQAKPDGGEEVDLHKARQAAMSPLSAAGGKAPSNTTLKDLMALPMEEFIAKTKGKNWDKLFRSGTK